MNAGTFAIITFALANLSRPLDARENQELSALPIALGTTRYERGGVSEGLDHQHRLIERQSCTPNSPEQNRLVAETLCDPYYVNNITYSELFDCGVSFANHEVSRCGTDRGTLCATYKAISDRSMVDYAKDIQNYCFRVNLLSETLANCNSECRTALEVFADNFGCCVHSETQITGEELAQTLTPLLWSQCGVNLPGPCGDTPTAGAYSTSYRTFPSCSFLCVSSTSLALKCKHIGSKLLQIYEKCGDTESANELKQQCGFNAKGQSCTISLDVLTRQSDIVFSVHDKCYRYFSANECTAECRDALEDMRERYGCCVNNINSTAGAEVEDIGAFVTSHELWSTCGVESPGFCTLPTDVSVYDDVIQCITCYFD